jgi:hypothetical protein
MIGLPAQGQFATGGRDVSRHNSNGMQKSFIINYRLFFKIEGCKTTNALLCLLSRFCNVLTIVALACFLVYSACIVNDVSYRTMVKINPQLGKDLKILLSSPELVDYLTVFRKNLDDGIKQKTHEMARNLKTHPKGRQILMPFKIEDLTHFKETDFSSIKDC